MATDLERLIVSIEANTKQFENAMRSLERTTNLAMGGVTRSVQRHLREQESVFKDAGEHFSKELAKGFFGISRGGVGGLAALILTDFVKDSVKVSAEAGSQSSEIFLSQWSGVVKALQQKLGDAISAVWLANERVLTLLRVPGGQLIEDEIIAKDTAEKRLEIERRRTTVLEKNLRLTEATSNAMAKGDFLAVDKGIISPAVPIPQAKPVLPAQTVLQDLAFEEQQLSRTNREQEIYNALKRASVEINTRYGQAIAEAAGKLYDEQQALKQSQDLQASFDKTMKDLIFEERQLGRTAEEQKVYNELKKAGIDIEDERGKAIALTTRYLHQEELALQAVKEVNDGLEASTKTFVQGLLEGQSAAEAFNAALRKMADALLDLALHSLFNPGGTPLLQSLFGGMLGLGQFSGGVLPGSSGSTASVSNSAISSSSRSGGMVVTHNTSINVSGSVDQKTLAAMDGMIKRNNARQNQELQRQWGSHQARYNSLRGP